LFVSAFDLFKIGLGPSSSHTMGPMRAAYRFVHELAADHRLEQVTQIFVDLYGSLALTGRGHGTDRAILLGLSGETPDRVDPDLVDDKVRQIREARTLLLDGTHAIAFRDDEHLRFRVDKSLAFHSNGMRFPALHAAGLLRQIQREPPVQQAMERAVGCCQSNGNLSPAGAGSPNPTWVYPMTARHSARAAERLSL